MTSNVQTIRHERGTSIGEPERFPSAVDGFNAAEFSVSPLSRQTSHMAGDVIRHEWVQKREGHTHQCFFQVEYGRQAPNSQTEDLLLLLAHLARQSPDPLTVEASIYELIKLQGSKSRPNQQEINRLVAHLDALMATIIDTNSVYDRDRKEWFGVRTSVLAGYKYKDEEDSVRQRIVPFVDEHGNLHTFAKQVRELHSVNFSPAFYEHFLKDAIPFDLGTYFSLRLPTAKRVYRFGNKYVQTFGSHSLDLQLFCLSRIGMSPSYVEKYKKPSLLASKLRRAVARVNETGHIHVRVEKSKTAPSGYLVHFDKPVTQLPLLKVGESFTQAEHDAHKILVRAGLYPNVAHKVVVRCRHDFQRDAEKYIRFVVRSFHTDWIKTGKLKVPADKAGGVLKRFFDDNWYYPHYIEHRATKEKQEWKDEHKRYADTPRDLGSIAAETQPELAITPASFALERFKGEHAELYARLEAAVHQRYSASASAGTMGFTAHELKVMADRALALYCKQCFDALARGETDVFPEPLREVE